jgi:hypothetical protein
MDRFGDHRVLDVFTAVLHHGQPVAAAAQRIFGVRWSELHEGCISHVQSGRGVTPHGEPLDRSRHRYS